MTAIDWLGIAAGAFALICVCLPPKYDPAIIWKERLETRRALSNVGCAAITPADRKRVVERLRRDGMTQAAIAKVIGVDQRTVSRDLEALGTVPNAPPVTDTLGPPEYRPPIGWPKRGSDDRLS